VDRIALVACWLCALACACGDNLPGGVTDDGGGGEGVVCRSNGLCLEHPRPLDVPLVAVTTGAANDIWAASAGDVLHWDGKGLHYERVRSREHLQLRVESVVAGGKGVYALAGPPGRRPALVRRTHYGTWEIVEDIHEAALALSGRDGDAWLLTASAHVMHLEGSSWIDEGPLPDARSLVATAPSEVWASFHDGRLAHYNGVVWSNRGRATTSFAIRSVVGNSDECWIVTGRDEVLHMKVDALDPARKPRIEQAVEVAPDFAASAIVGRSLFDIWLFGYGRSAGQPRILHYDGLAWTETPLPVVGRVYAATLAGDQLVTAGAAGEITRDADRGVVSTRAADAPGALRLVANAPGTADVWAVDPAGLLAHRAVDATWHVVAPTPPARQLFVRVEGEPWILDNQGALRRFDGAGFVDAALPYVYYACAQPSGGIVANTQSGTYASMDGRVFAQVAQLPYSPLSCPADDAVWGTYFVRDALGDSRLYPQGGSRAVAATTEEAWITSPFSRSVSNLDGGLWRTYDDLLGADGWIGDVAATSATNVWLVGAHGRASLFDGMRFERHDTGVDESIVSVQAPSMIDVTAVGQDGTIFHWNGLAWSSTSAPTPSALRDAHMFSATSGVAVAAADGRLFTYDGTSWTGGPEVFGAGTSMGELQVAFPTDMWAVDSARTRLWHFDGTTWTELGAGIAPIRALSVEGSHVHVLGAGGTIFRFDGTTWVPTTTIPGASSAQTSALVPRGNGTRFAVGGSTGYLDDGVAAAPLEIASPLVDVRGGTDGVVRLADARGRLWRIAARVLLIAEPELPSDVTQLERAMVLDDTRAWAIGFTPTGERRLLRRDGDTWVTVLEATELPDTTLAPTSMAANAFSAWFTTADGRLLRSP